MQTFQPVAARTLSMSIQMAFEWSDLTNLTIHQRYAATYPPPWPFWRSNLFWKNWTSNLPHTLALTGTGRISGPFSYCFDLATNFSHTRSPTLVNVHVCLQSGSDSQPADCKSQILGFLSHHYWLNSGVEFGMAKVEVRWRRMGE